MPRKSRRNVPAILWRLFGKRAKSLKDAIVDLTVGRNIQPEQCRCRGQGCLGCSRDKPSFLLRPDDPIHYRKLLHGCFVVLQEQTPPLLSSSPTSWWSQREIVEKMIEMMNSGCDCGNVICARYDKYDQSSPVLELLTSSSWEFLLHRVGHDLMVYLLQHTSIFLPFLGKIHRQVAGPPLCIKPKEAFSVHENKRNRGDSVQPQNKRQRFSSAVNDCSKDNSAAVTSIITVDVNQHKEEKPRKRSRLYLKRRRRQRKVNCQKVSDETPSVISCKNGTASTGNETGGRNLHTNGSLTDIAKQAKQVKRNKHFESSYSETFSVIPPKHILKTLRPNCSDSKSLMNHIFGEVNAWSTAPSNGKGNCPSGSICLYHSLLKSLKSLIGKTKSSHLKTLLDKHCPVLFLHEDALKSANATSQSSWRQNSDKLPHGLSSEKGKTSCHNVEETRLYCTKDQVVSFIWAVFRYIIPESLLGTTHQMRVLRRNIAWFVSRGRIEKCTEAQFLHRVKPSEFPLFASKQLCCLVNGHEHQNEFIRSTQQMLCTKWISWLFVEIVKKLVLFNFYATERQDGRLNTYYYRKCNWKNLINKEISKSLDGYVEVDNAEAESRRKDLRLAKFRFLPKANGLRMLLNYSSSSRLQSLRDTHAVLKDIQLKEPDVLGSSVFDHDDFYRNLGAYLIHLRGQSGELPPLFFVVADVFKAFDSIDQGKLLDVLQCVLKDEHILNRCRLVCCGKRSHWVNNILVSSNKNATFSRFTSTVPYNALQSIMVDQGENHPVKKTDLMLWMKDMLKNNMLQLDKSFFVKVSGIPQGHRLSSLLCCFYYGHLEKTLIYPFLEEASRDASAKECNREKELITPPSYKLLRFIDDYFFVSTSRDQATRFYQRLKHGFPDYNCFMNEKKFCINFEDKEASRSSYNRMYVGDNEVPFIRWTGLLINPRTFEVQVDYTRYLSGHISSTFSVAWENKPVRNLRHKLCYFLVPKCHPILFDSNINSGAIVRLNIYQIFLLAAMKFHCYVYELSRFWKLRPQTLSKFITRSIRYMFKLINRRTHRINTGSSFRPVLRLCKEEVIWLGLHAYIQVLRTKNSRYRTLLNYLKSALSKLNLPPNLWPEVEYATNRSNSSSLWKLSY